MDATIDSAAAPARAALAAMGRENGATRLRGSWLIGSDPRLRLRLSRILIAMAVYALSLLAQWHAVRLGMADAGEARLLAAIVSGGVCAFFVAIRFGFTLRFADPSLTLPQMVFGILSIAFAYQVNPQVRGVLPILAGLVIMFGVFTLPPRNCRALGWIASGAFGASMTAGILRNPAVYVPKVELHHFVFVAISLLTMSILAGQMSAMRLSWKRQNHELRDALARLLASERAMAEAKSAAEAASEAKSRFLANMSHEIRTPMNGVVGMADLLLSTTLTTRQQHFARTLRSSADAMLRLLNDILDFSKIEVGRLEIERLRFNVRRLVEEVALQWAEPAQAKGLELYCEIDPGAPDWVWGDPHRIRQALGNFVSNAVKFTGSGEIAIGLALARERGNTSIDIRFTVRDTGPGIGEEAKARLFTAFSQGDSSTTRKHGGTGLGLAITRQLAELMGGATGAESRVEGGTLMWLTLPCEPAPAESNTHAAIPAGLRVLVVEPHPRSIVALREALRRIQADCDESANLVEALARITRTAAVKPFDVVILRDDVGSDQEASPWRTLQDLPQGLAPRLIRMVPVSAMAASDARISRPAQACLPYPVTEGALRTALGEALTGVASLESSSTSLETPRTAVAAHVLLAEDNDVNAEIAIELLRHLGCSVVRVRDGRRAFEQWDRERFDVVLMDCQMPELDGFEATGRIRAAERIRLSTFPGPAAPRTPIIALTANALSGDRDDCIAAGMDDHLGKPFRSEQLRQVLTKWLGAPSNAPAKP